MIFSNIVIISAIPALLSAPRIVVPSEVIKVRPFKLGKCGKSATARVRPLVPSARSSPL